MKEKQNVRKEVPDLSEEMMMDLMDNTSFRKQDIIHLQDQLNVSNKNLASFFHLQNKGQINNNL